MRGWDEGGLADSSISPHPLSGCRQSVFHYIQIHAWKCEIVFCAQKVNNRNICIKLPVNLILLLHLNLHLLPSYMSTTQSPNVFEHKSNYLFNQWRGICHNQIQRMEDWFIFPPPGQWIIFSWHFAHIVSHHSTVAVVHSRSEPTLTSQSECLSDGRHPTNRLSKQA